MIEIYKHILPEIKGQLCFDIGANIGCVTKLLNDNGAKTLSIEPIQELTTNENFQNTYKILNACISNYNGTIPFYKSNYHSLSSCRKDWKDISNQGHKALWETVTVECITIDTLIKIENETPVFIKIDVEGYEYECLEGLNSIPKYLMIEYTKKDTKTKDILNIILKKFKNIINIWFTQGFKTAQGKKIIFHETDNINETIKKISSFNNLVQGDILIKSDI